MKLVRLLTALGLAVVVTGCASLETPSRNAPFAAEGPVAGSDNGAVAGTTGALPAYNVQQINVVVPQELIVSEANRYYPSGDIVWREDPPGNRHEQVAAIFEDAMAQGTSNLQGDVPVIVDVEVVRFHALTEKTRYTVGGIHSIKFLLTVKSAQTGLALGETREVQADLVGYGGQRAIDAMRQGQTQKVRITAHLANVIETELSDPAGYENQNLGMIQFLNNKF